MRTPDGPALTGRQEQRREERRRAKQRYTPGVQRRTVRHSQRTSDTLFDEILYQNL